MERIGHSLDPLKAALVRDLPPEEAPALAWPMVCGSRVAARTRVLGLAAGVLSIAVPDRQWRSELEAFAGEYVASFGRLLPGAVSGIRFFVEGEDTVR
jgi:hypothetical protein